MRAYIITDEQMKAAIDYLVELYSLSDDPLQPLGDRETYFKQWQGARRLFRRLGYKTSELEMLEKEVTA